MLLREQLLNVENFDDWVLRPENADHEYEYIAGEISQVVSNPLSSKTAALFLGYLHIYLQNHDIGHLTGADGGYQIMGERYIPDAAFISYARQPQLSLESGYNPHPPELAIEVLSPSNDDEKLRIKIANYLAAGVLVWVVDLERRAVEVYRAGRGVRILDDTGTLDGEDVLPDFSLPVALVLPKQA